MRPGLIENVYFTFGLREGFRLASRIMHPSRKKKNILQNTRDSHIRFMQKVFMETFAPTAALKSPSLRAKKLAKKKL